MMHLFSNPFTNPVARWRRARKKAQSEPLKSFYESDEPHLSATVRETTFVAVDFETTGLNPRTDEIISFGWVVIEGGRIQAQSAGHMLVKPKGDLAPGTISVHGISHDTLAEAPTLDRILPLSLENLAGRVLVAHHTAIEMGFLNAACQKLYGTGFYMPSVDTLGLEQRLTRGQPHLQQNGGLRLGTARKRYNLPRYKAHNACTDALAAAELFLAQVSYMGGVNKIRLNALLK